MTRTPKSEIVVRCAEGQVIVSGYPSRNTLKLLTGIFVLVAAGLITLLSVRPTRLDPQANFAPAPDRPAIYADNPDDASNRIFRCLFTRTVKARLSSEFDQGAPFSPIQYAQLPHELSVSTRLFERVEIGDRGIEPLYPSFINYAGVSQVLSEPLYSQLKQALTDALEEKTVRPPLDRALMQSDVWGAFDLLFLNSYFTGAESQQFHERRGQLLPLLARFIKQLALTPTEIERLPDNYAAAAGNYHLPGLFDQSSGWLEVQWHPNRGHDHFANYRRATRIFIKPTAAPQNKQEFLNSLRNSPDVISKLEAVALVTQNLLIDSNGKVVPSRLSYDVQLRRFIKNEHGALIKTEVEEYELSRRLLLTKTTSGGLVGLDEKAPIYLPEAGNDLGFASPQRQQRGDNSPILVTLRSRCIACHGQDVSGIATFGTNSPPPFPPVVQLNSLGNERALYVARQKMERDDFKALNAQH
jgi:hypothetical protein